MSVYNRLISIVTPATSVTRRNEARCRARASSEAGDWLWIVLLQHEQIEAALEAIRAASTPPERSIAQQWLAHVLNGHSLAEDSVLYPVLSRLSRAHARSVSEEQSGAKKQLALLKVLNPASRHYLTKLQHLQSVVLHHMYEEEAKWLPELRESLPDTEQEHLTHQFRAAFERHADVHNIPDAARGRQRRLGPSRMDPLFASRLPP